MKWLVVGVLTAWLFVSAQSKCVVNDFYGLSWIGNPSERHLRLSEWLTTNGNYCSSEQLVLIWNNLALWAGTADSSELRVKVLHFYGKAMEREKK
jgi:hypothetical protein